MWQFTLPMIIFLAGACNCFAASNCLIEVKKLDSYKLILSRNIVLPEEGTEPDGALIYKWGKKKISVPIGGVGKGFFYYNGADRTLIRSENTNIVLGRRISVWDQMQRILVDVRCEP
jgi:hypothetical protein